MTDRRLNTTETLSPWRPESEIKVSAGVAPFEASLLGLRTPAVLLPLYGIGPLGVQGPGVCVSKFPLLHGDTS